MTPASVATTSVDEQRARRHSVHEFLGFLGHGEVAAVERELHSARHDAGREAHPRHDAGRLSECRRRYRCRQTHAREHGADDDGCFAVDTGKNSALPAWVTVMTQVPRSEKDTDGRTVLQCIVIDDAEFERRKS